MYALDIWDIYDPWVYHKWWERWSHSIWTITLLGWIEQVFNLTCLSEMNCMADWLAMENQRSSMDELEQCCPGFWNVHSFSLDKNAFTNCSKNIAKEHRLTITIGKQRGANHILTNILMLSPPMGPSVSRACGGLWKVWFRDGFLLTNNTNVDTISVSMLYTLRIKK